MKSLRQMTSLPVSRCRGDRRFRCGPASCRFEPRPGRLATVARAEPRRTVGGNRAAEGLAGWRAAARLAGDRRRRRLFVVCASQGRLYTLGARGGTEYVMAFDAASGKRLWETAHGRRFSNDRGDGPRATPTIEGDRVYAFGASGDLSVLDAASGKVHWTVNVLKQYRGSNIQWGLSESPLVLEDRILVNAGGTIVALKKTDGTAIWTEPGDEAGYSSAVAASGRRRHRGDLLHGPARASAST